MKTLEAEHADLLTELHHAELLLVAARQSENWDEMKTEAIGISAIASRLRLNERQRPPKRWRK